ncbi:hypothetical protein ICW40_14775 [Actinotalea ferrariae]|uniref:Gmad2 immunoglobulin-like domain-containing protein n=1 Tax=Actinotalea ferrariae TaxID=1386098 RepID=UPI001C8BBCFA|nr:Gmad2 immunoglobulin-like domain-containing protein [Actinotalea ferrariae]MBX9246064.1 hypothetical protein [Actinotalea ferrariae]
MDRTARSATRSRARSALATAATAAVLVAGLAACQTGTAEDTPAATGSPTPAATSTASPAPTPEATPDATPGPSPTPGAPAVNGPNSITSPLAEGEVTSPFTARGEGTAFEATLLYRVLVTGTQDAVAEGFTTAGANGEVGPWEVPLDLEPGRYTLQVWEPGMSDGASGESGRNLVEVTFTVR